jgi:hypothetical protein
MECHKTLLWYNDGPVSMTYPGLARPPGVSIIRLFHTISVCASNFSFTMPSVWNIPSTSAPLLMTTLSALIGQLSPVLTSPSYNHSQSLIAYSTTLMATLHNYLSSPSSHTPSTLSSLQKKEGKHFVNTSMPPRCTSAPYPLTWIPHEQLLVKALCLLVPFYFYCCNGFLLFLLLLSPTSIK